MNKDVKAADARAASVAPILNGPVLSTLLKLAAPNLANAAARAAFLSLDAWFVSFLGDEALAGVALVFPFFLLVQTTAASAMGGGVSSAIARALGQQKFDEANHIVLHAIVVAMAMAAVFSGVLLLTGDTIYRSLGATGRVLEAASTYSAVVFAGSVFVCLQNLLVNVVRGTGAMAVSASVIVLAELVHVICSPILILGAFGIPSLGIVGAGLGVVVSYTTGTLLLLAYLTSRHSSVRLVRARLQVRLFRAILSVGVISSVNTVQIQLIYIVLTAVAAAFGASAAAGVGAALRLELTLLPLIFTVGSASVTMVGMNIGAGNRRRAISVAWAAAAVAGTFTAAVGLSAAIFASHWMRLFSQDAEIIAVGTAYLAYNGPAYCLLGIGAALFFACQGFGKVLLPTLANTVRLAVLALAGFVGLPLTGMGLDALFVTSAIMIAAAGGLTAFFFWNFIQRSR